MLQYSWLLFTDYYLFTTYLLFITTYYSIYYFLITTNCFQPSMLFLAPPIVLFLAKHPMVDQFDLSCIKTIMGSITTIFLAFSVLVKCLQQKNGHQRTFLYYFSNGNLAC